MRTMLRWTMPVEKGNDMVEDGTMGKLIESVMAMTKPESAYFYADGGERSAMLVFDLKESSDIPRIAETLFREANAAVEFIPVMSAEDLKKGLRSL